MTPQLILPTPTRFLLFLESNISVRENSHIIQNRPQRIFTKVVNASGNLTPDTKAHGNVQTT